MNNYKFDLVMDGSSFQQIQIPTGYKYFTVYNYTDNVIEVYQEHRTNSDSRAQLVKIPQYQAQTFPVEPNKSNMTFIYTDGGGLGQKKAEFIFSEENLGVNSPLGIAISGTVSIIADGVGLARESKQDTMITNQTATNSKLDTLIGDLSTMITNQTATNSKLDTLIGDLSTMITNQTTMITNQGTMITKLQELIDKP